MKSIFLAILLTFTSGAFAQTFIGNEEDINAILTSKEEFSINFVEGNTAQIVNRYTADAKLFPNNNGIIEGHEDIFNEYEMPENVSILSHKITPLEIKVINENAYAFGTYEGITLTPEGKKIQWQGKYVNVWRKEDGKWKVYLEIWNSTKSP